MVLRSNSTPRAASSAYVNSQAINTSGHLPPAQNVDSCCITPGADNTARTLMSGWRRWNSSTMRILRSRSSGLAAKKKVNASSSGAQPEAQGASDAAVSAPAPRSRLRRPNGLSSMVLPIVSLVPDGTVVLLGWPTRQGEHGAAQAIGICGDVD